MKVKPAVACKYKNVMLVDDSEIDNMINERMITSSFFAETVTVKTSGESALDYLKTYNGDQEYFPKVLFLDLNMPVMDGFDFLDEFDKLSPDIKNHCKIIVLSSSISSDDINKASINQYVSKYLNKPLNDRYLEAIHL